ncbi:MAG: ribulose-phosphate 3-epimerase [Anaerolineales bacterium]
MIRISASILSADFARLGEQIAEAEQGGADYIHVDVMDGMFVPNITAGPVLVNAARRSTSLPLDVHLMIEKPERYVEAFREAGADILTVHYEACPHLHRTVQRIRELGASPGVSLNPSTPLSALEEILDYVDLVLIMTVNPGFGGQKYIDTMTAKIARLRRWLDERERRPVLEVDGGLNPETAPKAARAGADIIVAGAAIFAADVPVGAAIRRLREAIALKQG